MKTVPIILACGVAAFLGMGLGAGLFNSPAEEEAAVPVEKPVEKKAAGHAARPIFPDDLRPACWGKPVPQAAAYDPKSDKPHPLVIFKDNGSLHEKWQELVKEEWQADAVDNTELVVVVSKDRSNVLSVTTYPNGAPPVSRLQYELDVQVFEARTGRKVGRNRFVSIPRPVRRVEDWDLRTIGQPVSFKTVFTWVTTLAQADISR